jgi:acetoin utilization deacetylase AcuC-like enzyme
MARVLLLTDAAMQAHAAPGHPERPERMAPVADGVADGAAASGAELAREAVMPVGDADLHRIHPAPYVRLLDDAAAAGGGWIDADTYLGPDSMMAARLAAGATVQAALAAGRGAAAIAFAVVRPPGHHAGRERPSGFCLLNNVAIAVERLRADELAGRVAVLDFDVHHGDGTQAIFAEDADVWYGSTHQSPLYPGTGDRGERGGGAAAGTKVNVPLAPGSGDAEFTSAWTDELLPAVEAFGPQAILLSAGYDAHRDDPLANLRVTEAGYRAVASGIGTVARRLGIEGVGAVLEGGYDLDALRASAAATVSGLLEGLAGTREAGA